MDFYRDGRLQLDELVSRRIDLSEVNQALEAMKAGGGARTVIVY